MRSAEFSTGFCFFYWPYWADKGQEAGLWNPNNRNDFGGFEPKALFIAAPKFADLKSEILSNKRNEVGIAEFEKALFKARRMSATKRAKALKASWGTSL